MTLTTLIDLLKKHMPHLKYLESLILKVDFLGSKFKELSAKVLNLEFDRYSNFLQILGNYSDLKMLHINVRIGNTCDFHKTEFMKAKSEFMTSHPQCQVCLVMDIDDDFVSMIWIHGGLITLVGHQGLISDFNGEFTEDFSYYNNLYMDNNYDEMPPRSNALTNNNHSSIIYNEITQ